MVKEWQAWPLDSIYPIVWLDAIHYKIRENGKVSTKAVYTILLTDLSNRGVKDILIDCLDGLKGFPEAIETIFPNVEVQLCVVHQIRNSLKYVASRNQKEFMSYLKKVHKATTKDLAASELEFLAD